MADKPPPRQRMQNRAAVLSTARSRRPHGHTLTVTPRPKFEIRPPPAAEAPPATPATEVKPNG